MQKIIGIIPARYGSSRFPGKPLIDIGGKTMIERVYLQAKHARNLSEVIVATDDQRIYDAVKSFAGNVVMTDSAHHSGTDRCAEVLSKVQGFDIAINIQGDEPFIDPLQIDLLCDCFVNEQTDIATLIRPIQEEETLFDPNKVKVVVDKNGKALYFSRSPIPFLKDHPKDKWLENNKYFSHIGIYGYRKSSLEQITQIPPSVLENAEGLEQLRWLESGFNIQTAESIHTNDAIDTPEDLEHILKKYFNS